jgi:hypothetical protein
VGGRKDLLQMVFLKHMISFVSKPRNAQPRKLLTWHSSRAKGKWEAHIGILSIDTGNEIGKTVFLLVLVRDEEGVRVEIAMVDLETSFVGNPVAIPEGRGTRKVIAGHIMESAEAEGLEWKRII